MHLYRPIGTRNMKNFTDLYLPSTVWRYKTIAYISNTKRSAIGLFTRAKGRLIAFENEIDETGKNIKIIDSEQRTFEIKNNENRRKMATCLKDSLNQHCVIPPI